MNTITKETVQALTSRMAYDIIKEKPPEWIMQGCLSQFRVNVERTFWTYGYEIYNPGNIQIPDHIQAHEERHMVQQAEYEGGKDAWWREYLSNPRFRMEQEAEAYGAQYKYFCKRMQSDRNQQARFLHTLAGQFSGPLYQLALTHTQATEMIAILAGKKRLPKSGKMI